MRTDTVPAAVHAPAPDAGRSYAARGLPIVDWVLRQQRRAMLGWAIALFAITAIYVSFFPAMGDGEELQALIDGLPEGMVAALGYEGIGSAAGYLESTVYGLLGPILLLVFAIGAGAATIAGLEEEGALELESCAPVSRRRVVLERAAALALGVIVLVVLVGLTSWSLVLVLDMDVAGGGIAAASLGLGLLVLAHGMIAFAIGAATGRRGIAVGVGAGLAVAAYIANALSGLLDAGDWLATLSTFAWYLDAAPLTDGPGLGFVGLAGLASVALLVAVVGYERRDLMV